MTNELYINGYLVDLPDDNVLAMSFQINQLNDMKTLNGNISNKITLPPTENNLKILGFIGDMNVDYSKTIRQACFAKYVQNGIEIIPQGTVSFGTRSSNGVDVTITAGNIDFFDVIGGNTAAGSNVSIGGSIQNLNLSAYDANFDETVIPNSRLNRSGFIYPLINYGDLTNASTGVQFKNMRPATYVSTIIKEIVKQSGFTLIDELATNALTKDMYSAMILPFSNDNFIHGQRYVSKYALYQMSVKQSATSILDCNSDDYPGGTIQVKIGFNTIVNDPSSGWSTDTFTAHATYQAAVSLTFPQITVAGITNGSVQRVINFHLFRNTGGVETEIGTLAMTMTTPNGSSAPQTFYNQTITVSPTQVTTGDTFYLRHELYLHAAVTITVNAPFTFAISPTIANVQLAENVELEATLPDIGQTDFIKAIANIFCGIVQTDSAAKTVHIVPFAKIPNNISNAVDWSKKVINQTQETTDVYIGTYFQQNFASYSNDDIVDQIAAIKYYGSAYLNIADKNIQLEGEFFTLPFSASNDDLVISGLPCIDITKIVTPGGTDFSTNTNPRICLLNFLTTQLKYLDGSYTYIITDNVPTTYFASNIFSVDMTMTKILAVYYRQLGVILNDQRKKTVPLQLTENDINQFDFFKPVYIERYGCYFYVSLIKNYVGGQPTPCSLIKIQ